MIPRLSELETIIFDLGEVIVDLNPQAVIRRFSELSAGKGQEIRDLIVHSPYLIQYETGQLTDEEFVSEVNQLLGTHISLTDFVHAWNLMIGDIPVRRLELMESLKRTHRVLILSNTNHFHELCFDEQVLSKTGKRMKDHVHTAYYSHDMGLRKPDQDIYDFVLSDQRLNPSKVLFLDDREDNIEAAQAVGIQAVQVRHRDQIFEILKHD